MARKYPIRITVYRKFDCDELEDYSGGCHRHEVGQVYTVKEDGNMPEGFCYWAWHDLWPTIFALRFGGNLTYCKEGNRMYTSCSDGLSPVVFFLERIED